MKWDFEIIDEDIGREMELLMAKLQPYDGEIIYGNESGDHGRTNFLGYEVKRYKRLHRTKRAFLVGTTITKHFKCIEPNRVKTPPTNNGDNDSRTWSHHFITPALEDEYNWAPREEEAERKIGRFREDDKF